MAQLFNQLSKNTIYSLKTLPKIIDKVFPLKSKHIKDLPFAISDLSQILTVQRSELKHSYWSSPRFASAYLRYFLPWNIIRLTRLLQGLDICEPYANLQGEHTNNEHALDMRNYNKNKQAFEAVQEQKLARKTALENISTRRLLVDVGSGPLTLPIALWLAKPEWRDLPLSILCLDTSPQALEYGKQIFYALAGNTCPWKIITRRASLNALHKELRNIDAIPWLLTGANVINELFLQKAERYEENFSNISFQIASFCNHKDAMALFVEPGTRLGGKNISLLREKAMENNLNSIAPCGHDATCPMQDSRSWCHFTFDIEGAPAWLLELSHSAFLTKTALSLSFILMQNHSHIHNINIDDKKIKSTRNNNLSHISKVNIAKTELKTANIEDVRIVSAPFKIPTLNSSVRYACSSQGLIIVKDAVNFTSGSKIKISWARGYGVDNTELSIDKKTGVRIVEAYNVAYEQSNTGIKKKNIKESLGKSNSKKEQILFVDKKEQNKLANNQNKKEQNTTKGDMEKKGNKIFSNSNSNLNSTTNPHSSSSSKEKPNVSPKVTKKRNSTTKDKSVKKSFFGKK